MKPTSLLLASLFAMGEAMNVDITIKHISNESIFDRKANKRHKINKTVRKQKQRLRRGK